MGARAKGADSRRFPTVSGRFRDEAKEELGTSMLGVLQ
jgi:hypothetical protein